MKVRKTVSAVIISVLIVVGVFALALLLGCGRLLEKTVYSTISTLNSSDSALKISYDAIENGGTDGLKITGIDVLMGSDTCLRISEIKATAAIMDLARMFFGIAPETVEVDVNGVSLYANDAVLDGFLSRESKGSSKGSFSLPFAVEITFKGMTADFDARGIRCSIGNINAFARLDRGGLAIANLSVPYIFAQSSQGLIEASDLRASADGFGKVRFSAKAMSLGEQIKLGDTSALVEFPKDSVKAALNITQCYGFGANGQTLTANINISDNVIRADAKLEEASYEKIEASKLELSASLTDSKKLLFASKLELARNSVSCHAELYGEFPDIKNLSSSSDVRLKVSDISTPVMDIENSLTAHLYNMDRLTIKGSLADGFDLNCGVTLSDRKAMASVELNSVDYRIFDKGINKYIPFAKTYFSDASRLNGKIQFSGKMNEGKADGGLSLNLSLSNLNVDSQNKEAEMRILAESKQGMLFVDSFSLNGFGIGSEFKGSIDLEKFAPKGELAVVSSDSDKQLLKAVFNRDGNSFDVKVSSEKLKGFGINTFVRWTDEGNIDVNSTIITRNKVYPVSIEVDTTEDLKVSVFDDDNQMSVTIKEGGQILFDSYFDGIEVFLDKETTFLLSGSGNGGFNLNDKKTDFAVERMFVSYADRMTVSLNMKLDNHSLSLSDINLNMKNAGYPVRGYLDLNFEELTNLASIDFAGLRKLDKSGFRSLGSESFEIAGQLWSDFGDKLSLYYNNSSLLVDLASNLFETPVKLKVLGSRDDGYYADFSYKTVSFEASFNEGKARLYKVNGTVGSFDLAGMEVELDTANKTLNGVINLVHTFHNTTGDVVNKADIELDASFVGFGDLIKGTIVRNAEYYCKIGINNAVFGGISIPDVNLNLSHINGLYRINGNLINGSLRSEDGYLELEVDPELMFGFRACGFVKDNIDLAVHDIFFPIQMVNPILNLGVANFIKGDITGDVLIYGPKKDLMYYGMLYCSSFDADVFYLPDQIITIKNIAIAINQHTFSMPDCPYVGYSKKDSRQFTGNARMEAVFQSTEFESLELHFDIDDSPLDFWMPMHSSEMDLNLRGDVRNCNFNMYVGKNRIDFSGKAVAENFYMDFELPENVPSWIINPAPSNTTVTLDMEFTTGKNVEMSYPSQENPLVSLTAKEGETVHMAVDEFGHFYSDGGCAAKTGRVYYFNNDFYVTDGHVYFENNHFIDDSFQILIDVAAKTRQYDSNGSPLDIYLNINKATFDDMTMRFSSSNGLSENEIIQIMGQAMLPTQDGISLSSVASVAYAATQAVQKLNLIESNKSFSLAATLRDAFNLDFLSAKTPLLANILVDALPGNDSDLHIIARYLNGTSLFAGKYFTPEIFGRVTMLLAASSSAKNSNGYFISEDLSLETELSLEWETPFATWTLSMAPDELSVFSFLDTIGLTVSKVIRY